MNRLLSRGSISTRVLGMIAGLVVAGGLLAYGITEEVPLGSVSGTVTMSGNGRALPNATVVLTPTDSLDPEIARPRVIKTDETGSFSLRNLPAGDYTIEASGKAHSLEERVVTVVEGEPSEFDLELKAHEPYLDLYVSQRVFLPEEEPVMEVHGFLPEETLKVEVFRIDLDTLVKGGGVYSVLSGFTRYDVSKRDDPAKIGKLVRSEDHKIGGRDIEGTFVDRLELESLENGLYWVRLKSGKFDKGSYVSVSDIGMVTKSSGNKTLCYVTNLKTGKPIPGASIGVTDGGTLKPSGKTGADGALSLTLPAGQESRAMVVAQNGSSAAISDFYRTQYDPKRPTRVMVYSDRTIYRPGDEVQFKGVVRQLNGLEYDSPKAGMARAELRDPDGNLVRNFELPISPSGTFVGSFSTYKESMPGYYELKVFANGSSSNHGFNIAAYRKPEYTVTVTPMQPYYVFGQRARAKIKSEYYFGGPVVGAKVEAYITRAPIYIWGDGEDESYEGYDSGESLERVEAVTDANGEAIIEFETKKPEEQDNGWSAPADYVYNVDASVAEAGDKYFDGSGKVRVVRGSFGTSVETSDYMGAVRRPVTITAKAFSHEDRDPLAGKEFRVVVGEEDWSGREVVFKPSQTLTARTNEHGEVSVTFTPEEPGYFVIKAIGRDERGNEIESREWLYVEGTGVTLPPTQGKLTVKLDKPTYRIGDTAKAVVQTSSPGGYALVTVEAEEVLMRKVVPLSEAATVVSFEVPREFAPNATVSAVYVKDKAYTEAMDDLKIDLVERKLNIELKPSQPQTLPGSSITYSIRTTDEQGNPVSAELSLGVVDESIYAIREDSLDPLAEFYPQREMRVQTNYSFAEIYLDGGDKGGANISIRREFKDTAFWRPTFQTDVNGEATVEVKLPDNLTTWRATVVGVTNDTMVGKASEKVRVSKPLMVRLQTPTYLVQGDEQRIAAVVTSESGRDEDVQVRLEANGVEVEGDLTRTVRVKPNVATPVEWTMKGGRPGEAVLTARAWVNGNSTMEDGVEQRLAVKPHGREFRTMTSGVINGTGSFTLNVRDGADAGTGRLVLTVTPSLASSLVQSLDDLVDFPYGCTEQTMSRFLPALLVERMVKDLGLPLPQVISDVPEIAAEGTARLQKMQHADGGWGWWEYDESDPFMTSLVLDGLARAKASGYSVRPEMIDGGVAWLAERVGSSKFSSDRPRDRAYMAYALAVHSRKDTALKALQSIQIDKADADTLAMMALAANLVGQDQTQADALSRLRSKAVTNGQMVSWDNGEWSWGYESSALALNALVTLAPGDPLIEPAVRYLMSNRKGEIWFSTRDTSYVLMAMTKYLAGTKELTSVRNVSVRVNGQEVKSAVLTTASLAEPDMRIEIPMSALKAGDNQIEFAQNGTGKLYYSADLRQVVSRGTLGALVNSSGVQITRNYYRLEARRLEDGNLRLMPSRSPITRVEAGDLIRVEITVNTDKSREFFWVEDPTPANCRVTEREEPYLDEEWNWWWSRTSILDDRVSFFARTLPAGQHKFTYTMRAENSGLASALPATGTNMYDPTQSASTAEIKLQVDK